MNQYDVAGTLQAYAEKVINARDTDHLKELIKEMKSALSVTGMKVER